MNWKLGLVLLTASMLPLATVEAANINAHSRSVMVSGGGYFPVLIRLHNGKLMAVLRGGAPHIGVKGRLDIVTSSDGGKTWSAPQTVVDGPDDDRNPALGELKNGTIVLGYAIISGYDSTGFKWTNKSDRKVDGVYVVRSSDGGKTWSKPVLAEATHALQGTNKFISPYGKIVQLKDGTALMSVYYEYSDRKGAEDYIFRSHDGGETWVDRTLVGNGYNETGLTVLPGGEVLAAMRSENGGHIAVTISKDQGRTWSTPQQITQDREHPGDLLVLKNKDVLMVYGERNKPFGVKAILSHDGGKTWDTQSVATLADDAVVTDCGYPSSVQLPDGKILTAYYQVDDPKNAPASAKAKAVVWTFAKK